MKTKTICKVLGGSRAYGLETPASDTDYRGVFLNTDPADILGLSRFDVVQKQETDDIVYYEGRKFFELLRDGNTGALEILFSEEDNILESSPEFEQLRALRMNFVDVDKMFLCLRGYMKSELRLANGERTGRLGGKRKAQLDQHGFSPKNFVQLFRLAHCGVALFQEGEFPVNIMKHDLRFGESLLNLKVNPENYSKEDLNKRFEVADKELADAYENRNFDFKFNTELANEKLREFYLPFLM